MIGLLSHLSLISQPESDAIMGFLDLGKSIPSKATPHAVEHLEAGPERERSELSELRVADPRPDLPDSILWTRLLRLAHQWDGDDPRGLYGALDGMRCLGARLEWDGAKYKIRPASGEYWSDEAAFQFDRDEWLTPHAVALVRLLRAIREGHESLTWWLRLECAGEASGRPAHEVIAARRSAEEVA